MMMVNRKLLFFGVLALVLAGIKVWVDISPGGGAAMIALGGVLLCEITLGGKAGSL